MSQNATLLFFAVVVQVFLVFVLTARMAVLRGKDLRAGLDLQSVALREDKWSARAKQAANSFSNQFELPVLFYVAAILFLLLGRVDLVAVILAWIFVLSRIVHAWIHNTSNIVRHRGAVYGIGIIVMMLMWIWLVVRVIEAA